MSIRSFGLAVLAMCTTACGSVEATDFLVNNREACTTTGQCELALILESSGSPFRPSRHYPSLDARDIVKVQWGDQTQYEGTTVDCVNRGICQFAPGGLLLNHQYPLGDGFKPTVELSGPNFASIEESMHLGTFEERNETLLMSFNVGLADTQVDYYSERREPIIDAINKTEADVVCLQEVWKESDLERFLEALSNKFQYNHYWLQNDHPVNWAWGHNGLLILSRYPISQTSEYELDYFFLRRSVVYATVETPLEGSLEVACTHLSTHINIPPYLGDYDSWEDEQNAQARQILERGKVDALLGDFNSGIATETISAYTPEAYNIIIEGGYFSPYMDAAPGCTWCVDNPIASDGDGDLILDHIFLDNRFASRTITSEQLYTETLTITDWLGRSQETWLSDHTGIRISIEPNSGD